MKRKLMLVSLVIILILVSSLIIFRPKGLNSKQDLVKRVLEIAVVSGEIPDYNLIKDNKNIILSSENLDTNLILELDGIKFTILSPAEIKEKANKEGDLLYLKFNKIYIGDKNASISLDNTWAVSETSKAGYLSGGGFTVTFHKFMGSWVEDKSRKYWIS